MKAVNHSSAQAAARTVLLPTSTWIHRKLFSFFSYRALTWLFHFRLFFFFSFIFQTRTPWNKPQHLELETEFDHTNPARIKKFSLLPSWCPVWPQLVLTKGSGGHGGAERCEKQVFGSVNVCNQVTGLAWRGQTQSDKHKHIRRTQGTAELIFTGEIKAIFVCGPSCLIHSEPQRCKKYPSVRVIYPRLGCFSHIIIYLLRWGADAIISGAN